MDKQYQLIHELVTLKNRNELPWRNAVQGYIKDDDNNVIAIYIDDYIKFPGGGIDNDENPVAALKRECMEEAGIEINNIKFFNDIYYIWKPEWPKTSKQKKRYKQYKGAYDRFYLGKVKNFATPTSKDGDSWLRIKKKHPLKTVIKSIEGYIKKTEGVPKKYRLLQLSALKRLINY